MLNRKEEKIFTVLSIVESILCIIAFSVFMVLSKMEASSMRYVFYIGIFYMIIAFLKNIVSLFHKKSTYVIKNSKNLIEEKYLRKLSNSLLTRV